MRVFVTGASGWVGAAVVPDVIQRGHEVVGLARSDASADRLVTAGAEVQRGSLEDLDSLQQGATDADGVIHLAFIHDFAQYEAANEADRAAIEAMAATLAGTGKPLVIASGVATTAVGRPAVETDAAAPDFPRSAASTLALGWADRGVRTSVVRLPPTVHGQGDTGFIPMLIDVARAKGIAGYLGDGANVWPAVHRADAATVFRAALESAPAGSVWHAVGEQGIATRAIAETIGRHLDIPVASVAIDDAIEHFGWIGLIWALDAPTSSTRTREQLGWNPTGPGLLEDLDRGHYFRAPAS